MRALYSSLSKNQQVKFLSDLKKIVKASEQEIEMALIKSSPGLLIDAYGDISFLNKGGFLSFAYALSVH